MSRLASEHRIEQNRQMTDIRLGVVLIAVVLIETGAVRRAASPHPWARRARVSARCSAKQAGSRSETLSRGRQTCLSVDIGVLLEFISEHDPAFAIEQQPMGSRGSIERSLYSCEWLQCFQTFAEASM